MMVSVWLAFTTSSRYCFLTHCIYLHHFCAHCTEPKRISETTKDYMRSTHRTQESVIQQPTLLKGKCCLECVEFFCFFVYKWADRVLIHIVNHVKPYCHLPRSKQCGNKNRKVPVLRHDFDKLIDNVYFRFLFFYAYRW